MQRAHRGFTLIELVVTLALLGVLAMLAAPMTEAAVQRSREQALRESLREIRDAIDRYRAAVEQGRIVRKLGESGYPPTLEVLVDRRGRRAGPEGRPHLLPAPPAARPLLRRPPRARRASTWGLRSYESPADEPRDGDDVYDVYSTAAGTGLDGTPYREW